MPVNTIDPVLLEAPVAPPAPLPPLKIRAKGRPRKGKPDSSTHRDPSAFELNGALRSSQARNTPRSSSTQAPPASVEAVDLTTSLPTNEYIDIEEIEASQALDTQEPSRKRHGRPAGSKDKQPRKRRTREELSAAGSLQKEGGEVEKELEQLPNEE